MTGNAMRIERARCMCAILLMLAASLCGCANGDARWTPAQGRLMTRWAQDVKPSTVHAEYPRPQMVRSDWLNLNGLWDYAIVSKDQETAPAEFDGQILVPFAVESALSGVSERVGPDNRLWYRRSFDMPEKWRTDKRLLLHFGAVDWKTTVWVNGQRVGQHLGGYDPFTFDITDALTDDGAQEIVLSVWDPTDAGGQARGKQVRQPEGIWYTPVTGIWQTVWIEPVAPRYIRGVKMVPDIDNGKLNIEVEGRFTRSDNVTVEVLDGDTVVAKGKGLNFIEVEIPEPHLWSPDDPFLYHVRVTLGHFQRPGVLDQVQSYVGMRKISLAKDESGINRLFLNNKPLFHYGPLDQGWWPDGLYTAPTDEALKYDIEVTKQLGCNMARKHVKVEPARWYYWCDKLGLMVWQDMPNGNNKTAEGRKQFESEWTQIIKAFGNHPSIVMWVPFNEGWGQYDTPRIVELTQKTDPSRLVNNASGWTDKRVGDVHDMHKYPGPGMPPIEESRAAVLGEFGGLGLPVAGHTWQDEKNWGYRSYADRQSLTQAYVDLLIKLRSLIGEGLSAAVYTQTTDVEIEVNGLMTYDRAMIKMNADRVRAVNEKLYLPPPKIVALAPTSELKGQVWRYTTTEPAEGWQQTDFDDSAWEIGKGGFGTRETPGAVVGTVWDGFDIWIRRGFYLDNTDLTEPYLVIHHDEDAEIYINGVLVTEIKEYTTGYEWVPLNDKGKAALKVGLNRLAVHCEQTDGGQYIDVGLIDVIEQTPR